MALLATEALVLRGYKLGETSKVVVLLTRERGKLRAVARGARGGRPRYQSALEPLSEVRVTLYGRQGAELLRLGQAELLHSAFRAGTRSLDAALFLSGCAELLDAFSSGGRGRGQGLPAGPRGRAGGREGRQPGAPGPLPRGLAAEAARPLPAARPLRRLRRPLPAGGALRYHRAAHGFVCGECGPASGPDLLSAARAAAGRRLPPPPDALPAEAGAGRAALEAFHRELISAPPRARPPRAAGHPRDRAGGRPVTLQEIVFALAAVLVGSGLPHPPAVGRGGRARARCTPRRSSACSGRGPGGSATCSPRAVRPTAATARTRTASTSTSSSR